MMWEMNYLLSPKLTEEGTNGSENIDGIQFTFNSSDGSLILTGFVIRVDASSEDEALTIAQIKANRVLDFLTGVHHLPIGAHLANFKTPEGKLMVQSDLKIKWNQFNAENIDLSSVDDMLKWDNIKLMRQLSHYRMGLKASDDIITQIREFYMIVEDEKREHSSFISDYKGIRDFVSHPLIRNPYVLKPDGTPFEKNYLDLSDPKAIEKLRIYAGSLNAEAEQIITKKLKP
jgi:hypothetical protein